jgi:hypothetical protein
MQNDGVAATIIPTGAMDAQVVFLTLLYLEDEFNSPTQIEKQALV